MIKEIKQLRLSNSNLGIVTIDTGDSSSTLICSAIYVRFERKNGSFYFTSSEMGIYERCCDLDKHYCRHYDIGTHRVRPFGARFTR